MCDLALRRRRGRWAVRAAQNHGRSTSHTPEVILNNFTTRLGHTIGRQLAALFPQQPQFTYAALAHPIYAHRNIQTPGTQTHTHTHMHMYTHRHLCWCAARGRCLAEACEGEGCTGGGRWLHFTISATSSFSVGTGAQPSLAFPVRVPIALADGSRGWGRRSYVFKDGKRVNLQELGPQFCLRLQWLQKGTFDLLHGDYEWQHKVRHPTLAARHAYMYMYVCGCSGCVC
jgi:hypothetical protein